jgi:hypothetical protein
MAGLSRRLRPWDLTDELKWYKKDVLH